MNTFRKILNSKGMVVISTLVLITVMIVIMVGIASMEVLTAAKASGRVNEAFRYLNVMEEMAQVVARARLQGVGGVCPAGYTLLDLKESGTAANFCIVSAGVTSTCLDHTDYNGVAQKFCLRSLSALYTAGTQALPPALSPAYVPAVASGYETPSSSGTTTNADYHLAEPWFPAVNAAAWTVTKLNEMSGITCTLEAHMWEGCMVRSAGVTMIMFTMCKPTPNGVAVTTCTNFVSQKIAVY